MSTYDEQIDRLQKDWSYIKARHKTGAYISPAECTDIQDKLAALHLNINSDETYEYLAKDLTHSDFQNMHAATMIRDILRLYRTALDNKDHVSPVDPQYNKAVLFKKIIETSFPDYFAIMTDYSNQNATFRPAINQMEIAEIDMLAGTIDKGHLEIEMKKAALLGAQLLRLSLASMLVNLSKETREDAQHPMLFHILEKAEKALTLIDIADDEYAPSTLNSSDYYGLEHRVKVESVPFSKEAIETIINDVNVMQLAAHYQRTIALHEKACYAWEGYSDLSFGRPARPIHDITEKLMAMGYVLSDTGIYDALDTDEQTFKTAYNLERMMFAQRCPDAAPTNRLVPF